MTRSHGKVKTNDPKERRIKTSSSERDVPLHPFLLELGFHRYAQEQKDKPIVLHELLNHQFKGKKLGCYVPQYLTPLVS